MFLPSIPRYTTKATPAVVTMDLTSANSCLPKQCAAPLFQSAMMTPSLLTPQLHSFVPQIIVAPPVVHMATMDSPLPTFPMVPTAVPPAQVALVSSSSVTTTEKEETTVRRPPWKKKRASKTRDEEEDEDDEEFVPYDDSEEEGVAEDEDDEDFQGCTEGTTKRKATKRKQKQRRVASSNEEVDDEKNEEDDTASTMYRSSVRYSYPLRIGPDGAFSAERVIIPVDELISINESRRPGARNKQFCTTVGNRLLLNKRAKQINVSVSTELRPTINGMEETRRIIAKNSFNDVVDTAKHFFEGTPVKGDKRVKARDALVAKFSADLVVSVPMMAVRPLHLVGSSTSDFGEIFCALATSCGMTLLSDSRLPSILEQLGPSGNDGRPTSAPIQGALVWSLLNVIAPYFMDTKYTTVGNALFKTLVHQNYNKEGAGAETRPNASSLPIMTDVEMSTLIEHDSNNDMGADETANNCSEEGTASATAPRRRGRPRKKQRIMLNETEEEGRARGTGDALFIQMYQVLRNTILVALHEVDPKNREQASFMAVLVQAHNSTSNYMKDGSLAECSVEAFLFTNVVTLSLMFLRFIWPTLYWCPLALQHGVTEEQAVEAAVRLAEMSPYTPSRDIYYVAEAFFRHEWKPNGTSQDKQKLIYSRCWTTPLLNDLQTLKRRVPLVVHLTDGRPVYETLRKNRKHYYNRDLVIIASYTGVQPHVFIADDTCEELPITMMATTLNEPAAAAAPPPLPLSQQVVVNSAVVVVPPSFPAAVVGAFPKPVTGVIPHAPPPPLAAHIESNAPKGSASSSSSFKSVPIIQYDDNGDKSSEWKKRVRTEKEAGGMKGAEPSSGSGGSHVKHSDEENTQSVTSTTNKNKRVNLKLLLSVQKKKRLEEEEDGPQEDTRFGEI